MPVLSIPNVRIAGLAAAVPPLEERTWADLALTNGKCAIARKRNKTPFRRKAKPEQCQSDFCAQAAKILMADLGWKFAEIDTVVMATLTPDYPIPPTAIILQDRLCIPKTAVAFDIPSGDIGFLHGLQVAASLISPGFLKKALLFTGEVSKTADEADMGEPDRILAGDNGCVVALEHSTDAPAMYFDSCGDGAGFASYHIPYGGTRSPVGEELFADAASTRKTQDFVQDAQGIGEAARRELPDSLRRVMDAANKSVSALDGCYLNPIGLQFESAVRTEMEIPRDKFYNVSNEFGNCASGSLPLAMIACGASRLRTGSRTSLLGGIGAGFAWGGAVLTTDRLVCPDIIEL